MDNNFENIDEEYEYYSKLYRERFQKKAYLAMPGGSKKQTIDAIKKSLEADKDLLDEVLYQNSDDKNILY